MGRIPDDVIERVLAAHDVAEVVGRYVTLKRAGRAFKALCPFHEEKTPSFTVNPDRQTFKCFGCGKGGTAITFLMEHARLSFPEALRSLAQERGIEVPEGRGEDGPPPGELERIRAALDLAQRLFTTLLTRDEGREARAYLERRGYDAAARQRFGLGYAPAGWDRLLTTAAARRIPAATLEAAGLVLPRQQGGGHYDRFRNRVTFPVRDLQGRVVSFGARALDPADTPKYLNGPETAVFRKGDTLFALDLARAGLRATPVALLMEGYTDVLMAHLHGFDRAVAGMGTALTPQQAARLERAGATQVLLVYDADDAGRAAAEKAIDVLLERGLEVRVAVLPEGRDVDELLLEEGPAAFQAVLDAAQDVFAFRWAAVRRRHDLSSPRGRAEAAGELAGTLARVKNPVERDLWIATLVERLGGGAGTERELRARLGALSRGPRARRAPGGTPAPADPLAESRRRGGALDELHYLAALLTGGELGDLVARAVGSEDFENEARRRVYNAVLDMREARVPHDLRACATRFSDDPEALAELGALPDDPRLAERVRLLVQHLEERRLRARRSEALREALLEAPREGPRGELTLPPPDASG